MGHPKGFAKAALGGTGQVSDFGWSAPRLATALLNAPVGSNDGYRTDLERDIEKQKASPKEGRGPVVLSDPAKFDDELKALFKHIATRLSRTLDEAWLSKEGYGMPDLAEAIAKVQKQPTTQEEIDAIKATNDDLADLFGFWFSAEEVWARAFTERFAYSMYHSPGQAYGYGSNDKPFYDTFFPAAYPIAVACQNLSTFCILSRGIPVSEVTSAASTGLSCSGGSVMLKAFASREKKDMAAPATVTLADLSDEEKAKPGALYKAQQKQLKEFGNAGKNKGTPPFATVKYLTETAKITPGSILVFNPGGFDFTGQDVSSPPPTHVASVLRVSGPRIQIIDTGVVIGDLENPSGEGGTADHSFLEKKGIQGSDGLVGVGILRDPGASTVMEGGIKLWSAEPLGFTRLVVVETDSKKVLFVSKLLHMRWPVAKLLWSLRGLPATGVTVIWLVYVPASKKWTEALAKDPTGSIAEITKEKPGALALSNLITATSSATTVYRSHVFSDWRRNLEGGKITSLDESALEVVTTDPPKKPPKPGQAPKPLTVFKWSVDKDNFGKRYVRKPNEDKGTVDGEATGDALVD